MKQSRGDENNCVASLSKSENVFIFYHPMSDTALSVGVSRALTNPSYVRVNVGFSSGLSGHFQLNIG